MHCSYPHFSSSRRQFVGAAHRLLFALFTVTFLMPGALPAAQEGRDQLQDELVAKVKSEIEQSGVAVLTADVSDSPCFPGDAIGLSRAEDPRNVWKKSDADYRCFNWSGLLGARHAEGYLALQPALRLAEVFGGDAPLWTIYPTIGKTDPTPGQLRAMLHLAVAYGSQAVLVSDEARPELKQVVSRVAQKVAEHDEKVASLKHVGLDIRCKNGVVQAIPRKTGQKGALCVYAVNMDAGKPVETRLLLWDDVWDWTKARDVYAGEGLPVRPRDEEGYLSVTVELEPGEGKLIETDARVNSKK